MVEFAPSTGFVHLHVASGFSMRHGAATPQALVERAAAQGQPALALTDRDGLYGAIRFATAALSARVAPIVGVDLALRAGPPPPSLGLRSPQRSSEQNTREEARSARRVLLTRQEGSRAPVRGGAIVDPRLPRIVVLARGQGAGVGPAQGWSALCRLVTDTHLRGERGTPVTTPDLLAARALPPLASPQPARLRVLLGPDSDVGRALLTGRVDRARDLLLAWRALLPDDALAIEVVHHGGPDGTPGCRRHAARLLGLADETGLPAVLTAAVRHLAPEDAVVADVLDAARRLVVLDTRHLDRVTDAGHLADTATMWQHALTVTGDRSRAVRLFADTMAVAAECAQDPRADLGLGAVHLPEPEILEIPAGTDPQRVLAERCRAAIGRRYPGAGGSTRHTVESRLEDELAIIAQLGYPTYFLTVAAVTDLIRERGVRVAARGSGAGSLINYLLEISGVDPIRHDLLMERFCSPLRAELPDIDVDVESARRTEIYEAILERFGGERVTCVSMMDTYKVRHAIRDVGAALGMPPAEVDEIAKAFPHIRARDARSAIADLPELRIRGLDERRLATLFDLVERLDGLPRHIALHPCGVILSNAGLLDRTPVEASWLGFPMSQFDKDDVEVLGLLKLDVLGIRMQSAMAHAVAEVARVEGVEVDLDDEACVPLDDEATYRMIRTTRTLGCFQIESPGQRELIGKFGPERFDDLIIDISLFRPGPVKSDMITPFLESRHGWRRKRFLHPSLIPSLAETEGVVVFHEQVLRIVAETTGVSLAQADEVRRAMGTPKGQEETEAWWRPAAKARGYTATERDEIWEVLKSFASFGFCKAHAAAFALPTYHSAWLKTHHPAAFLSGVLTHDPGMYPKRLLLDDARSLGIAILPLDVNASREVYRIEALETVAEGAHLGVVSGSAVAGVPEEVGGRQTQGPEQSRQSGTTPGERDPDLPDGSRHGIRLSLADVKGISGAEVASIIAGQPYADLADFWSRAHVSRPVVERLVLAGAFDDLHGLGGGVGSSRSIEGAGGANSSGLGDQASPRTAGLGRRGRITRRDLLLHVAELDRWQRSVGRNGRSGGRSRPRPHRPVAPHGEADVRALAAAQSQAATTVTPAERQPVQLLLDLGDRPDLRAGSGLPEMTGTERVRAELDILGLDASAHVIEFYAPMLQALGVTRSIDLIRARSGSEVLVGGVKVATQTPPVRSGRRVVFLTVDDGTGPADATFFEDVQGPYAATVFHSWLLLVRGLVRRTGQRGLSLRATGAWEIPVLWEAWQDGGIEAVRARVEEVDRLAHARAEEGERAAAGPPGRRVLVHASGFRQSPYADTRPAGVGLRSGAGAPSGLALPDERVPGPRRGRPGVGPDLPDGRDDALADGLPPRKLWHSSPGSSGH